MSNYMTIGKVSEKLKLNPRTLRFYDKIGLVKPDSRSEKGYRLYSLKDVERLMFINRAKKLGLTLEEIQSILSVTEQGLCKSARSQVAELLSAKILQIENSIKEMEQLKKEFTEFRTYLSTKAPPQVAATTCSCLE